MCGCCVFARFFVELHCKNNNVMLSILIPTYNYDCTQLVRDLHKQVELLGVDYEIIVMDDASPIPVYREKNRVISALPHCRLIELEKNLGRARIRNRLADEAHYEWLLFMDSDAEVISDNFIVDYLKHTDADVVCGGLCHADELPSPEVSLRYAYEKRADKKRAAYYRAQHPYEQFITFCFMVRASVFHTIRFDETITEYGHEDTLFGVELSRRKVNIRHIDNPMCQGGIETNMEFVEKSRAAIRNLVLLEDSMEGHSTLLSLYRLLCRVGLDGCVARWFVRKEQRITGRLVNGGASSVCLFFIYKLGYFCLLKCNKHLSTTN